MRAQVIKKLKSVINKVEKKIKNIVKYQKIFN